jgi:DNA-binding MarR family transcriptional regulator
MDQIKEAFQKVKEDITSLNQEIESLKINLAELNWRLVKLGDTLEDLKKQPQTPPPIPKIPQKHLPETSTHASTHQTLSTHPSTHPSYFKPLKDQNMTISTGNQRVPADRQTNRQTNRHIENELKIPIQTPLETQQPSTPQEQPRTQVKNEQDPIQDAAQILDSLDSLKKEIRLKFKRLTDKEILIFSSLYQLEEEQGHADYKALAQKLSLTESSIRDYIARLISKGIPVEKHKINNKTIQLRISDSLKKVASLPTILKLRDL